MKLKAKCNLSHGGRNIDKGQQFEVADSDGPCLIESGFAEAVEKKKPRKKNAKKSAED